MIDAGLGSEVVDRVGVVTGVVLELVLDVGEELTEEMVDDILGLYGVLSGQTLNNDSKQAAYLLILQLGMDHGMADFLCETVSASGPEGLLTAAAINRARFTDAMILNFSPKLNLIKKLSVSNTYGVKAEKSADTRACQPKSHYTLTAEASVLAAAAGSPAR